MRILILILLVTVSTASITPNCSAQDISLKICDDKNNVVAAFVKEGADNDKYSLVAIPSGQVLSGFTQQQAQNQDCKSSINPFPLATRYNLNDKTIIDACIFKNKVNAYLITYGNLSVYSLKNCELQ